MVCIGGPPGSNLETMLWVSSALSPPPSRGLRSQAYALENISGNIANSQTTAFKRIDTSFLDLIPQTGVNNQLSGSVTTQSRETNTVQGDIQTASKATFMAISGNGFFVTQKPGSFTDNQPVFSGIDNYTRRGDFTIDKNGCSRQRRGLLSRRHSDRSHHRQHHRQRSAGAQVRQRFYSRAAHDGHQLSRQPCELSVHKQARQISARIRIVAVRRLLRRSQPGNGGHAADAFRRCKHDGLCAEQ